MPERDKLICIGAIGAAHGVRGLVKLRSFTDEPEDICAYGPLYGADGERFDISLTGRSGAALVARIEGIADREAAMALKGTRLHVDRASLPETEDDDEFYHFDLIGLAAVDRDGTAIGTVSNISDFGAGDVVEITRGAGLATLVLPFNHACVPEVDIPGGRIVVEVPAGLDPDRTRADDEDDDALDEQDAAAAPGHG